MVTLTPGRVDASASAVHITEPTPKLKLEQTTDIRASLTSRRASLVSRPMVGAGPGIVHTGVKAVRTARAPAIARRTATVVSVRIRPRLAASSSRRVSSRRAGSSSRSACVMVSPASRAVASRPASYAVRKPPSARYGSAGICGAEESGHPVTVAAGQGQQETPVEEPVRPLTRGLRGETATVAGRPVQEVLRVTGRPLGADRVGRAAGRPPQRIGDQDRQPVWFAECDQTAEGSVAVRGGRADEQSGRGGPVGGGVPGVEPLAQAGRAVPAVHCRLADQDVREGVSQPVARWS